MVQFRFGNRISQNYDGTAKWGQLSGARLTTREESLVIGPAEKPRTWVSLGDFNRALPSAGQQFTLGSDPGDDYATWAEVLTDIGLGTISRSSADVAIMVRATDNFTDDVAWTSSNLPNGTNWMMIVTQNHASLPSRGQRIDGETAADIANTPVFQTTGSVANQAVNAQDGRVLYRGIRFLIDSTASNSGGFLQAGSKAESPRTYGVIVDRCIGQGHGYGASAVSKRWIAGNCDYFGMIDCHGYDFDFGNSSPDAQAYNSTAGKTQTFINSRLIGSSQGILIGGTGNVVQDFPSDLTFIGCKFDHYVADLAAVQSRQKARFEIKYANRALAAYCDFSYCDVGGQRGHAIKLTCATQGDVNSTHAATTDVAVVRSIIHNSPAAWTVQGDSSSGGSKHEGVQRMIFQDVLASELGANSGTINGSASDYAVGWSFTENINGMFVPSDLWLNRLTFAAINADIGNFQSVANSASQWTQPLVRPRFTNIICPEGASWGGSGSTADDENFWIKFGGNGEITGGVAVFDLAAADYDHPSGGWLGPYTDYTDVFEDYVGGDYNVASTHPVYSLGVQEQSGLAIGAKIDNIENGSNGAYQAGETFSWDGTLNL